MTQLLVWVPLIGPVVLVLFTVFRAVRQRARSAAVHQELRNRGEYQAATYVREKMEARFHEAFTSHRRTVRFHDLGPYAGFEKVIAAAAAKYRYHRTSNKTKPAVYRVELPSETDIAAAPEVAAARERVHAEFGIDPFDKSTTEHHRQQENNEQRKINWFNGLLLMPAVVCCAVTLVGLGGGRTHDPGEETLVGTAPTVVVVTGILTVVLGVAATLFIVKHYRRMKRHKNLADGPGNALAWEVLMAEVSPAGGNPPVTGPA